MKDDIKARIEAIKAAKELPLLVTEIWESYKENIKQIDNFTFEPRKETEGEKEAKEAFNFLFDYYLSETTDYRKPIEGVFQPTDKINSDLRFKYYLSFREFAENKSLQIIDGKSYITLQTNESLLDYLNDKDWSEFLIWEKGETSTPPKANELICDKMHLQKLHAEFDGQIWESMELEDFLNCMSVEPIGKIEIKETKRKNKIFAKWLHENIENQRDADLVPNFGKWFIKLIGKNINYSAQLKEH